MAKRGQESVRGWESRKGFQKSTSKARVMCGSTDFGFCGKIKEDSSDWS